MCFLLVVVLELLVAPLSFELFFALRSCLGRSHLDVAQHHRERISLESFISLNILTREVTQEASGKLSAS